MKRTRKEKRNNMNMTKNKQTSKYRKSTQEETMLEREREELKLVAKEG